MLVCIAHARMLYGQFSILAMPNMPILTIYLLTQLETWFGVDILDILPLTIQCCHCFQFTFLAEAQAHSPTHSLVVGMKWLCPSRVFLFWDNATWSTCMPLLALCFPVRNGQLVAKSTKMQKPVTCSLQLTSGVRNLTCSQRSKWRAWCEIRDITLSLPGSTARRSPDTISIPITSNHCISCFMSSPPDVIQKFLETVATSKTLKESANCHWLTVKDPFNLLSTENPQSAANIGWFPEIDAGAALWGLGCSPGAVVAVAQQISRCQNNTETVWHQ